MKIAMLVPYFYPHLGGTEKYVKDLSVELATRGHEVTVISNNIPKAPKEEKLENIFVKRLDAINLIYLPISFQFNLNMLKGFDIVHTHCPPFGFTRAVRNKLKIPHVVTYHCDTTVSEKFLGIKMPDFVIKSVEFFTNTYAKMILPKVDAIITTTESYAVTSPVMKHFPHFSIPIGIHYELFDESKERQRLTEEMREKNKVLFLGRLAANKGIDYLVHAIPLILKEVPDAKFVICGEGEEKPHIEAYIDKVGVRKHIEFKGRVNLDEMVKLYYTSTVFVFPSINRLEAFGIVQLEAMACYTPVIASDIPGVNNVMEPNKSGILVKPKDSQAIADAVVKILKNPEMGREMGKYGRKLIEQKYNWKAIGDKIEEVYKIVLERKHL